MLGEIQKKIIKRRIGIIIIIVIKYNVYASTNAYGQKVRKYCSELQKIGKIIVVPDLEVYPSGKMASSLLKKKKESSRSH